LDLLAANALVHAICDGFYFRQFGHPVVFSQRCGVDAVTQVDEAASTLT
jgi:hypothetical protein